MSEIENPEEEPSEEKSKYSRWSLWFNVDYFTNRARRKIFDARYPKTHEEFDCEVCWRDPQDGKILEGIVLKDRGRILDLNIAPRIFGHPINLMKLRGYISTIEFSSKTEKFYLEFCYDSEHPPEATEEVTIPPESGDDPDFKLFKTPRTSQQMTIPVKAVYPGGEQVNKQFRLPNYLFISFPDEAE